MGIFDFIKSLLGSEQSTPPPVPPPPMPQPQETKPSPLTDEELREAIEKDKEAQREANRKLRGTYRFSIVGTYYRGREAMDRIEELQPGERLRLKKDKKNRYSKTAIRVFTEDGMWIGYVNDVSSERIFNDMEEDESDAEFLEAFVDENDYYYTDEDGVEHEKHYFNGIDYKAFYRIPNFEEKQREKKNKKEEENAIQDLKTPEGRMECNETDYEGMTDEELKKQRSSIRSKLLKRKKRMEAGDVPENSHLKELYDIQITNMEKALKIIGEKLKKISE